MFKLSALVAFFTLWVVSAFALPTNFTSHLEARSNVGEGTYFDPGLGACGITNVATDYIVAVSTALFNSYPGATTNPNLNPICNKRLTANYNGRSVTVAVTDKCYGCAGLYDLDFTISAIQQLVDDPVAIGRITGVSWDWI
ncbi:plant expansin [Hymenopellis radicata]|nr:plant expansin [Hymenopellis radicata]